MKTGFHLTEADIQMMEDAAAQAPLAIAEQDLIAPQSEEAILDAIVERSISASKAQERRLIIKKIAKLGSAVGALSYAAYTLGSFSQRR